MSNLPKNLGSDQGWGCLIRVAQMALANILEQYCKKKEIPYSEEEIISCTDFLKIEFLDEGKFSLKNFVQQFGKK